MSNNKKGKINRYRVAVFRSNKNIYAQIIDDVAGKTLVSSSSAKLKLPNNIKTAQIVGEELATKAIEKKLSYLWLDRGNYKYHGRIKALTEKIRDKGLIL